VIVAFKTDNVMFN